MNRAPIRPRPAPLDPSAELRALAARVRRLGTAGRTDSESVTLERLTIAAELAQLASTLESASCPTLP